MAYSFLEHVREDRVQKTDLNGSLIGYEGDHVAEQALANTICTIRRADLERRRRTHRPLYPPPTEEMWDARRGEIVFIMNDSAWSLGSGQHMSNHVMVPVCTCLNGLGENESIAVFGITQGDAYLVHRQEQQFAVQQLGTTNIMNTGRSRIAPNQLVIARMPEKKIGIDGLFIPHVKKALQVPGKVYPETEPLDVNAAWTHFQLLSVHARNVLDKVELKGQKLSFDDAVMALEPFVVRNSVVGPHQFNPLRQYARVLMWDLFKTHGGADKPSDEKMLEIQSTFMQRDAAVVNNYGFNKGLTDDYMIGHAIDKVDSWKSTLDPTQMSLVELGSLLSHHHAMSIHALAIGTSMNDANPTEQLIINVSIKAF
jgi:hypothetical protein